MTTCLFEKHMFHASLQKTVLPPFLKLKILGTLIAEHVDSMFYLDASLSPFSASTSVIGY